MVITNEELNKMNNLIVQVSKIVLIILFALFTLELFSSLRYKKNQLLKFILIRQRILMFLILLLGNAVSYTQTSKNEFILLFLIECLFLMMLIKIYNIFYQKANQILIHGISMLLIISFIILPRLNYGKSTNRPYCMFYLQ